MEKHRRGRQEKASGNKKEQKKGEKSHMKGAKWDGLYPKRTEQRRVHEDGVRVSSKKKAHKKGEKNSIDPSRGSLSLGAWGRGKARGKKRERRWTCRARMKHDRGTRKGRGGAF